MNQPHRSGGGRLMLAAGLLLVAGMLPARGSEALGRLMHPDQIHFKVDGAVDNRFYGESDAEGAVSTAQSFDMSCHRMGVVFPVLLRKNRELLAEINYKQTHIDTKVRLPKSNERVPENLYDIEFNLAGRQSLANDWTVGMELSIGSSSDRLFHSGDELNLRGTFFLRVPSKNSNAWYFVLDAGLKNGQTHAMPGLAYLYAPNDHFYALIGAPLTMVHYEPLERISLDMSYRLMRNFNAKATVKLTESVDLFAAFDWEGDSWARADRRDDDDTIAYREKRLSAGITYRFHDNLMLKLAGGYAFDRMLYESDGYDERDDNQIDIDSAAFADLSLAVRF